MESGWKAVAVWGAIIAAVYLLVDVLDLDALRSGRRPLPADEGAWIRSAPAPPPEGPALDDAKLQMNITSDHVQGDDVIGTAFAVSPDIWVTAAHVVGDCKTAYVKVWGVWRRMDSFAAHEDADVAILKSPARSAPPALGVTDRLPVLDQDGYHIGFPGGKLIALRSRLVGMARIVRKRARRAPEMGWVWAELDRDPFSGDTLGGISGGPQVDRTGAVQGVTTAYGERTKRIVTMPVSRLREVLPETVPRVAAGEADITERNFGEEAKHARAMAAIAAVYCSASGRTRPQLWD